MIGDLLLKDIGKLVALTDFFGDTVFCSASLGIQRRADGYYPYKLNTTHAFEIED
jgi:hypothetical protein